MIDVHVDVLEWWLLEHAHSLCEGGELVVQILVHDMLACMRGRA